MSVQEIFAGVKKIETSMRELPPAELTSLLVEKRPDEWDEQMADDLNAGRLD